MSDEIPVTCAMCGDELDGVGSDHRCSEGMALMAAIQTGDSSFLDRLENNDTDADKEEYTEN